MRQRTVPPCRVHGIPLVLGGQGRSGRELQSAGEAQFFTWGLGALLFLLWLLVPNGCSGPPKVEAQTAAQTLPALLPTPSTLPATAKLGLLTDIKRCLDSTGVVLQQSTDPDIEDNATSSLFVAAIHWKQTIAIATSVDGVQWSAMRPVLNASSFGPWSAQGVETPSLKRPTPTVPVWTLLCSGYPSVPGLPVKSTTTPPTSFGRVKSIYLATAPDVSGLPGKFTPVGQGPVIGTCYSWATPYMKSNGFIDSGMDEPAHIILGQTWVALVTGTSYAQGQAPQIGLSWSIPPNSGRAWLTEPDPVVPSENGEYVAQADLLQDPRDGSFHALVCRSYAGGGEGIHHIWSTDLRNWVEPDPNPIVRTTPGTSRAGRCFGGSFVLRRKPTGEWYYRLWWSEVSTVLGPSQPQIGPWTLATGVIDAS